MNLLSTALLVAGVVQTITAGVVQIETSGVVPMDSEECCNKWCSCYKGPHGILQCGACSDCYRGSPCCGNGPCNIFCCNCDNGCRQGRPSCTGDDGHQCQASAADFSMKPPIPEAFLKHGSASQVHMGSSRSTFDLIDSDHSGSIDLEEYLVWANSRDAGAATNATLMNMYIEYFYSFDKNGDGTISFDEMHRPAKEEVPEL